MNLSKEYLMTLKKIQKSMRIGMFQGGHLFRGLTPWQVTNNLYEKVNLLTLLLNLALPDF